jgi:hypothetical protein
MPGLSVGVTTGNVGMGPQAARGRQSPMNTKELARHYDVLSPRECYSLMVAARLRGDVIEAERLANQAPRASFSVPHYRGLAEGMAHLSLLHVIQLLDIAAQFWQTEALLESVATFETQKNRNARESRLHQTLRLWGYLFVVETEAWNRFCAELHLDPEAVIRDMPGYPTVKKAEPSARAVAFSAEEITKAARARVPPVADICTIEMALADFRAALASRESCWT